MMGVMSKNGNPRISELAGRNRARSETEALRLWRRVGGVGALRRAGRSITEITAALNAAGVRTPRGGPWHRTSIARVIARAERLEAEHGEDADLVTWEHVRFLRAALLARAGELKRLHPRHAAELDVVELPDRPEGAKPWKWVALGLDAKALQVLREAAAAELDRVRAAWRFAREDPERLERARRLWTRPHEIEPEGLMEALLVLTPDLERAEVTDDDFADVVGWLAR